MTNLSIVIPVHDQVGHTRGCLASLAADLAAGVRVVVVDNASTDGTADLLAAQPQVTVLRNPENRGCAPAWNQGVEAANATWTVILNNDVLVTDGWLAALIGFAERDGARIVSPALREGELNYDLATYARDYTREMGGVVRRGVASGICFAVHRDVFERVGGFDERFRIGQFEDTDFFLRVRDGKKLQFPAEDALKTMEWVAKAEKSISQGGKWIT